jgi:hypothetical protein
MSNSPYGPQDVRRVSFKRLPKAIRDAGISMIAQRKPDLKHPDTSRNDKTQGEQPRCEAARAIRRDAVAHHAA